MFQDRILTCVDCHAPFTFTASEQEFYAEKGFTNDPKRCPECRSARKQNARGGRGGREDRQLYPATCAACGQATQIPFEPRKDRPVYCRDCYQANNNGHSSRRNSRW